MTLTHNTAPMVANLRAHIEADALIRNVGYENGKGCFIGCAEKTYDPELIFKRRGIPMTVTKLGEAIFEGYSETPEGQAKAVKFTQRYTDAICDGLDLSLIHWSLLRDILADIPKSRRKDVDDSVAESLRIITLLAAGSDPEPLKTIIGTSKLTGSSRILREPSNDTHTTP